MCLDANDIDVFHGAFTVNEDKDLRVKLDKISKNKVDGFSWEINTVECDNLSAHSFLKNNDLNITACCFHVDFATDGLFSIHASPCFWQFLFQNYAERKILTINQFNSSNYGANTCV